MSKLCIRSQDRTKLVFLGNGINCVEYMDISVQEKRHDSHAIIVAGITLGIYKSRERCLAILDEIQQEILSYIKSTCGLNIPDMLFNMPDVYQMPEK